MELHKGNPYSVARVFTGMKHIILGKAVTSIAGVGTLLVVVRGLSISEFAAYSVMFGIMDIVLVATSLGAHQILTRYVPEIFSMHYARALRRLLAYTLGLRFLVLLLCLAVLAAMLAFFASVIGLSDWQFALKCYLLVVLFRTVSLTLFQVLEATLSQGRGQGAFALVTASKFVGVVCLHFTGHLSLISLIAVEIATEALGAILMSIGVSKIAPKQRADAGADLAEYRWLRENRRRMLIFGFKGYFQNLIIMPFSGMFNRLIVGGSLPVSQVAVFGFAQTVLDLMLRYLPAQMFAGMMRPVMAARFSQSKGFVEVQSISNAALKANLVLIGLAAVVAAAGGGDMMLMISGGKYGSSASWLILLMCMLAALESWRHVLDQISHTVERYGFLVFSNALLGASLFLGLALMPRLEIFALPLANCAGLLVANLMVMWWLRSTGYRYRPDVKGVAFLLLAVGLTAGIGYSLESIIDHWQLRAAIAALVYFGLTAPLLLVGSEERRLFDLLVSRRRPSA